jgi:chemotaxis family two-component system response regulator Rcp1
LGFSSGSITTGNADAPALDGLFAGAWLNAAEEESESLPKLEQGRSFTSLSPDEHLQPLPQRRILLMAEDNPPDALLVREVIRMENLPFEIHVATDGEQAVDFIAKAERDPDSPCPQFLLLDLNLPKLDGFEVLQRLRSGAKCKDIPVLVISSSNAPADRSMAAGLGAGYFRKPSSYYEFLELGKVLRQMLQENGVL